ncbi:hypothetical protein DSM106972_075270 [Dulcicalothrix desertica PCC 7102]|uniref:Uncharacterized protein n=1 Tax=Dulcicalothrix desertica PCC 7102 TaxID=232991 RepID=A0A3S1AGS5_9CYAN|nr:hypothetical protein [Dulcicalothrix desertica]RUT00399.1 hypothetical protein DSM106972_075270 [Dulcicalothrix desertica PCC 7102]TWH42506.1 hypothetical protein CAL7102_06168 [Dulcicalothrix desertica PCC 7102]
MAELNQQLYNASLQALTDVGIPEPLADAASRIVATDDASQPNLGRTQADREVCYAVADIYNKLSRIKD